MCDDQHYLEDEDYPGYYPDGYYPEDYPDDGYPEYKDYPGYEPEDEYLEDEDDPVDEAIEEEERQRKAVRAVGLAFLLFGGYLDE